MNVSEVIAALQKMPADAEVLMLWDGDLRSGIDVVWLARDGEVGVGPWNEPCYSEGYRPAGSPPHSTGTPYYIGEVLGVPEPQHLVDERASWC